VPASIPVQRRAPRVGAGGRRRPQTERHDELLDGLGRLEVARQDIVREQSVQVVAAREAGATWAAIAAALQLADPKVAWSRYCDA